jgi:heat shock protein HslJ
MKTLIRILLLGGLLLTVLAACTSAPAPSGSFDPADLLNKEWKLTQLNGQPPLEGTQATLRLEQEESRAGGSTGCNSYGGAYTLTGDALAFDALFMTEMACMEPVGIMEQEAVYLQALDQVTSARIAGGNLELRNSAGDVLLVFAQ